MAVKLALLNMGESSRMVYRLIFFSILINQDFIDASKGERKFETVRYKYLISLYLLSIFWKRLQ